MYCFTIKICIGTTKNMKMTRMLSISQHLKKKKTAFEAMLKRADRKAIVKNKTISKLIEQIK